MWTNTPVDMQYLAKAKNPSAFIDYVWLFLGLPVLPRYNQLVWFSHMWVTHTSISTTLQYIPKPPVSILFANTVVKDLIRFIWHKLIFNSVGNSSNSRFNLDLLDSVDLSPCSSSRIWSPEREAMVNKRCCLIVDTQVSVLIIETLMSLRSPWQSLAYSRLVFT